MTGWMSAARFRWGRWRERSGGWHENFNRWNYPWRALWIRGGYSLFFDCLETFGGPQMNRSYHYQRRSRRRMNLCLAVLVALASAGVMAAFELWRNLP
jgi:hypothetical protein